MKQTLKLMGLIADMEKYPTYILNFSIKNNEKEKLENEALNKAILIAQGKAEEIRKTIRKPNVEIINISVVESFRNINNEYTSQTVMKRMTASIDNINLENLSNTINPEDIFITINVLSQFELS